MRETTFVQHWFLLVSLQPSHEDRRRQIWQNFRYVWLNPNRPFWCVYRFGLFCSLYVVVTGLALVSIDYREQVIGSCSCVLMKVKKEKNKKGETWNEVLRSCQDLKACLSDCIVESSSWSSPHQAKTERKWHSINQQGRETRIESQRIIAIYRSELITSPANIFLVQTLFIIAPCHQERNHKNSQHQHIIMTWVHWIYSINFRWNDYAWSTLKVWRLVAGGLECYQTLNLS